MSEERRTTRSLKCILTPEELKTAGSVMAAAVTEKNQAEDDLKSVSSQFKAKIATAEAMISLNASRIQNGYEFRSVDCIIREEGAEIVTIREDTFEVVERRTMTPSERQGKINFDSGEVFP